MNNRACVVQKAFDDAEARPADGTTGTPATAHLLKGCFSSTFIFIGLYWVQQEPYCLACDNLAPPVG